MTDETTRFFKNPKVEILFAFYGGKPIITKQDKYKPLKILGFNFKNLYQKINDKDSVAETKQLVAENATKAFREKGIIKKPSEVEVLLSFSVKGKRFNQVDIDNLTKTVLDGLNGIAFEDDSQVTSLIVNKHIHEMKIDALFIGVTELNEKQKGFVNDIKLTAYPLRTCKINS